MRRIKEIEFTLKEKLLFVIGTTLLVPLFFVLVAGAFAGLFWIADYLCNSYGIGIAALILIAIISFISSLIIVLTGHPHD